MSRDRGAEGDRFASGRPQGRAPGKQLGVDLNGRFYVNSADSVGVNRLTAPEIAADGSMRVDPAALDGYIVGKVALREFVQERCGLGKSAANEIVNGTLYPLGARYVGFTKRWSVPEVHDALAKRDAEISALRADLGAKGGRARKA